MTPGSLSPTAPTRAPNHAAAPRLAPIIPPLRPRLRPQLLPQFGSTLAALLCLVLALTLSACKAKFTADPDMGPGTSPDLSDVNTMECEQTRCLDPTIMRCCNNEPCVDVSADPRHCGGCGMACGNKESCVNSQCVCRSGSDVFTCGAGFSCCPDNLGLGGGCRQLDSDPKNCGVCSRTCKPGESCTGGNCACGAQPACAGTKVCCGGGCVDAQTDTNNCGACGKKCAAGKTCKDGLCEGECGGTCTGAGMNCCGFTCANVLNDPMNCGKCGNVCPAPAPFIPPGCLLGNCVKFGGNDGGASPDM